MIFWIIVGILYVCIQMLRAFLIITYYVIFKTMDAIERWGKRRQ